MSSGNSRLVPNIPDHELLRIIGHGAYGEVWLARNALGAYRAIKIVHRKDFEESRPFEREFSGIQKFEPISRSHEGLVHILQVGRREDYFYYVMELADDASAECGMGNAESESDGAEKPFPLAPRSALPTPHSYAPRTLREDLRRHGRLPADRCVEIGLALASALAHLHKHGLVHRDVKPSNIILVGGKPKLADIGLVTDAGDSQSIVGTEGYLPPEGPGTPQADIFSLGKVLYEIGTGQDRRQFPDLPPDLRDWLDSWLVLELNQAVLRACAADVSRRYESAEEMREELAILHRGQSVRRKRAIQQWLSGAKNAGVVMTLLALVAGAFVLLRPRGDGYVHSANPKVNKLLDQGNTIVQDRTPDQIRKALDYFNQAVDLDPRFVPARFCVFRAYLIGGGADDGPADMRQGLREAADKLRDINRDCAETHAACSMIRWIDWKFPEARAEARLAIKRPAACIEGRAAAHLFYGWFLLESGQPDQALEQYKLSENLLPNLSILQQHLGCAYLAKGDFDVALRHYRTSLDLRPGQSAAHFWIGRVFEEQKKFMQAIAEFEASDQAAGHTNEAFYAALREAVRQQDPVNGYWSKRLDLALHETQPDPYYVATLYARLGTSEKAYDWLEKACAKRTFDRGLMRDSCWNHQDTNFIAIAKRIGLLE
jgi:serine/threonine protein kinase